MTTFAVTDPEHTLAALNYALSNLGSAAGVYANNVLTVDNITNTVTVGVGGEIYSYNVQWLNIRYATNASGTLGFSTSPTGAGYYGLQATADQYPTTLNDPAFQQQHIKDIEAMAPKPSQGFDAEGAGMSLLNNAGKIIGGIEAIGAQPDVGPQLFKCLSQLCSGGFMFTQPELATAVRHRIPLVSVIFNDNAYGNVRRIQATQYGNRLIASDLRNPDFGKFVDSFGAMHRKASNPNDLRAALRAAFAADVPAVIEVPAGPMPDPWGKNSHTAPAMAQPAPARR